MLDNFLILRGNPGQDVTAELRSLMDQAVSPPRDILIAGRDMVISGTIEMKADMQGHSPRLSGFVSTIADGSPTFEMGKGNYRKLEGFSVKGQAIGQNTTLLKLGDFGSDDPTNNAVRRSVLRDVHISRAQVGLSWLGWINHAENVHITDCEVGARLEQQNGSNLIMTFEANAQPFVMQKCRGVHMPTLVVEGDRARHTAAATVDDVLGLTIGMLYVEGGGAAPLADHWIKFGPGAKCINLNIENARIVQDATPILLIDNVEDFGMLVTQSVDGVPSWEITAAAVDVSVKGTYFP